MPAFADFVFYVFAAAMLGSAAMVVTAKNPVHAALFLVLSFVAAAGLWLLLHAEFLAIALVLVYVGAVMVLFLFVLMMLDINLDRLREGFWKRSGVAVAAAGLLFAEIAFAVRGSFSPAVATAVDAAAAVDVAAAVGNTRLIGQLLYTDYVYPFQLAALVLLVAIVAAIALTIRPAKNTRRRDPGWQVRARAEDRVRLVSMPSAKSRRDDA